MCHKIAQTSVQAWGFASAVPRLSSAGCDKSLGTKVVSSPDPTLCIIINASQRIRVLDAINIWLVTSISMKSWLLCLQISLLTFTSLSSLPLSSFFTSSPCHNLSVFLFLLSGSFLPSLPFLHRRFPVSDIPTDSDEVLADWLIRLYQEKVIVCLIVWSKINVVLVPNHGRLISVVSGPSARYRARVGPG